MSISRSTLLALSCSLLLFGCSKDDKTEKDGKLLAGNLRPLTQAERAADFDQMINQFKLYYGPYNYKESRLGINIEQEGARLKTLAVNAASDEEFAGYVYQFGAMLKDGHVGVRLTNSPNGIQAYRIPIFVGVYEGKVLIDDIDEQLAKESGLSKGDEIVEVDGKAPLEYLPIISKYKSLATEKSNLINIFRIFLRGAYMTELVPQSPNANLKVRKASDESVIQSLDLPWTKTKYNADLDKVVKPVADSAFNFRVPMADEMNSLINNINLMGDNNPFFVTPQVMRKYNLIKLYPSADSMKKAGLKEDEKPPIYVALYRFKDKNLLLVRNSGYSPSDYKPGVYLKAYKAILTEFQPLADILVLDQTHNPGGSYCASFYELFAKAGDQSAVQKCNADRRWINALGIDWANMAQASGFIWDARNSEAMASIIEKAYDAGSRLSDPIPLFTGQNTVDNENSVWKKPMIVLIDELAGSCGDIFPMLIKSNKRAKLFGQATMGLGGNVEPIDSLANSRISISLTRGIFTTYKADGSYRDSDFIENNGVSPDIEYSHTVKDMRNGFVDYVKAFSEVAVTELQPPPPPPAPPAPPASPAPVAPTPSGNN